MIKNLHVENFRGLESLTMENLGRITLISLISAWDRKKMVLVHSDTVMKCYRMQCHLRWRSADAI